MSEPCLVEEYLSALEKGGLLNIVACSGAKVWSKHEDDKRSYPARITYQGVMFKQAVDCFKNFKNETGREPLWLILSAKYGLIEPDEKITNYNISFSEHKDRDSVIDIAELLRQWEKKELGKYSVIFVWGGEAYVRRIEQILDKTGNKDAKLFAPAVGLPINKAQKALKDFRIALAGGINNHEKTKLPATEKRPVFTERTTEKKLICNVPACKSSKYYIFKRYLENCSKDEIDLSFSDIESILGFKLPQSAFDHRAWWSNHDRHVQSFSWNEAGYETTHVDLQGMRVRFNRCNKR